MYTKTEYLQQRINAMQEIHPYAVSGKPDTYSDFNQGWEAACSMLAAELGKPLPPLQQLSIADLVALIIRIEDESWSARTEHDVATNLTELRTELRTRYAQLFPNNQYFSL